MFLFVTGRFYFSREVQRSVSKKETVVDRRNNGESEPFNETKTKQQSINSRQHVLRGSLNHCSSLLSALEYFVNSGTQGLFKQSDCSLHKKITDDVVEPFRPSHRQFFFSLPV